MSKPLCTVEDVNMFFDSIVPKYGDRVPLSAVLPYMYGEDGDMIKHRRRLRRGILCIYSVYNDHPVDIDPSTYYDLNILMHTMDEIINIPVLGESIMCVGAMMTVPNAYGMQCGRDFWQGRTGIECKNADIYLTPYAIQRMLISAQSPALIVVHSYFDVIKKFAVACKIKFEESGNVAGVFEVATSALADNDGLKGIAQSAYKMSNSPAYAELQKLWRRHKFTAATHTAISMLQKELQRPTADKSAMLDHITRLYMIDLQVHKERAVIEIVKKWKIDAATLATILEEICLVHVLEASKRGE